MRTFNIKKSFTESSFSRVFKIIKKKPTTYFCTIILDFIFLALITFIGKYIGSLIPKNPQQLMDFFKSPANLLLFALIYASLYYLLVIFLYSITKLSILNLIKSLYTKSNLTLKGLKKFYLLNIQIFVIFFLSALVLFVLLALVLKRDFLKYIVLILLIPFVFFLYSIININHTLYIKNEKTKIIRKSFYIAFNKMNKYGMSIIWAITLTIIYLSFFNLIHLIFRFFIFSNRDLFAAYGNIYLRVFNILSIIFIYLIIAFNRIYFYERIDKNVLS